MNLHNNHKRIIPVIHGENGLRRIAKMPKGETTTHDLYIAGHSESGHNHVLKSKGMEVLEKGGKRYVLIKEVAELFHQKTHDIHETVSIEPGIYEVTHKTEYSPWTKVRERVFD